MDISSSDSISYKGIERAKFQAQITCLEERVSKLSWVKQIHTVGGMRALEFRISQSVRFDRYRIQQRENQRHNGKMAM